MRSLLVVLASSMFVSSSAHAEPLKREKCGPADGAPLAIKLAFSDLVTIHRARIPGPSGQRVIDAKVDALLTKVADLPHFASAALSPMWDDLEPDKQASWAEELRVGLRGHYLKRLTGDRSPVGQRLEIVKSDAACDRATVALLLGPRGGRGGTEVTLTLGWDGLSWRAIDVFVDGVSLLETWKNRFRMLHKDGGVAAVDEHLHDLARRYREP